MAGFARFERILACGIGLAASLAISSGANCQVLPNTVELTLTWGDAVARPNRIIYSQPSGQGADDNPASPWKASVSPIASAGADKRLFEVSLLFGTSTIPVSFRVARGNNAPQFDLTSRRRNCNRAGIDEIESWAKGPHDKNSFPALALTVIRMMQVSCDGKESRQAALAEMLVEPICEYVRRDGMFVTAAYRSYFSRYLSDADANRLADCENRAKDRFALASLDFVKGVLTNADAGAATMAAAVADLEEIAGAGEWGEVFAANNYVPARYRGYVISARYAETVARLNDPDALTSADYAELARTVDELKTAASAGDALAAASFAESRVSDRDVEQVEERLNFLLEVHELDDAASAEEIEMEPAFDELTPSEAIEEAPFEADFRDEAFDGAELELDVMELELEEAAQNFGN